MSFDLEVLVVNQEQPIQIPFGSSIEVINEIDSDLDLRFFSTWKIISNTKGIWYSLVKEEEGVQNAYPLCNSDFEAKPENLPIPFWVTDKEVIYHLTPLIIHKEFREDFKKIINYFLDHSPSNTIMFLARYQGGDYEIIQGTLSLNDFLQHLNNNNILFNVCYSISNK